MNGSSRPILRALYVQPGTEDSASPIGPVAPGASAEADLHPGRWTPTEDLGFAEGDLGYAALHPMLRDAARGQRRPGASMPPMLIAVLDGDEPGLEIDAGVSGRSRTLTILLVREGTP